MPSDDDSTLRKQLDEKDAEIKELKDRLKADAVTIASLSKDVAAGVESVKDLQKQLKKAKSLAAEGDCAIFDGRVHKIIGDFRADSTFVEVKKGNCPEGVTLLAIERPH